MTTDDALDAALNLLKLPVPKRRRLPPNTLEMDCPNVAHEDDDEAPTLTVTVDGDKESGVSYEVTGCPHVAGDGHAEEIYEAIREWGIERYEAAQADKYDQRERSWDR